MTEVRNLGTARLKVLIVEGSADTLDVGDELELKVDDQAKSAVILNVLPQDKDRQS